MKTTEFQENLLKQAKEAGFAEAEMYYEKSSSFRCTIFEGEIDSYETSEEAGIGFRGLYEGKMGYAYSEKIEPAAIDFLVERAKVNAQTLDEDDGTRVFEGSDTYASSSFYSEGLAQVSNEEKINLLKAIEKKVLAYDERIVSLNYCLIQDFFSERVMANDKGLAVNDKRNGLLLFVSAVAKEGEEVKSGSALRMTRDFSSIDVDEFVKEVAEEALAHLGGQAIATRKYPVIMRRDASASLLAVFSPIFSAENTQKDLSLLKGKVGEKIASSTYTLVDDPFHEASIWGEAFDGEGVATRKQEIISQGKLNTLLHNRKTAKKDGVETTGHAKKSSYKGTLTIAPINLYIQPGEKTKEELIASVDEGVLITDLAGLHSGVSAVSGDFSVAASGFYIKDGKIASPIKQMTIAGNYFDYLKQIEEVGSDLKFAMTGVGSPSLRIQSLSVTVDG